MSNIIVQWAIFSVIFPRHAREYSIIGTSEVNYNFSLVHFYFRIHLFSVEKKLEGNGSLNSEFCDNLSLSRDLRLLSDSMCRNRMNWNWKIHLKFSVSPCEFNCSKWQFSLLCLAWQKWRRRRWRSFEIVEILWDFNRISIIEKNRNWPQTYNFVHQSNAFLMLFYS